MSLRFDKSLVQASDRILRVTAIAWSPNGKRLAVVNTDKVVLLYDDKGELHDKFKAKANAEAGHPDFVVRAMAYSPDSTRLAIAQSDNIVFVYKLGLEWGDKKSICNKLIMQVGVTSLVWRTGSEHEVVYGLADGSLKLGVTSKNKALNLYQHPAGAQVVSLACRPAKAGAAAACVYAGHVDGAIYRFTFVGGAAPAGEAKLCVHSCVPYALACGADSVLAGGADLRVAAFSAASGQQTQVEDYSGEAGLREFMCAAASPAGDTIVMGAFDAFVGLTWSERDRKWARAYTKAVPNMYSVTAAAWEPSGGRLVMGTLTGGVDSYTASLRRLRYAPPGAAVHFDLTYTSKSQVQISMVGGEGAGPTTKLTSAGGHEIVKVDIYRDQYVVAFTTDTLLLGNLATFKLSEIPWRRTGAEKFHFENERVVMVYTGGELTVVEYALGRPLLSLRTEHASPFLLSCVVNDGRAGRAASASLAYLVDAQTARVLDVHGGGAVQVAHEARIDWLELNQKGSHLLFRDARRHLHLYCCATGERSLLLNYVGYVQWVPDSDVIVAQSRDNLCVWYSIQRTEQPFIFNIKGEVQGIEKTAAATEVLVQEDPSGGDAGVVGYQLDDNLVYFGAAMEDTDYERAMDVLEPLEQTPDTEAQWLQLAEAALAAVPASEPDRVPRLLAIAERCYTATGDVARARFLHAAGKKYVAGGTDAVRSEAKVDMVFGRWANAEQRMVGRGLVDDAIAAYLAAHRWRDAIRVAEESHHLDADDLKRRYFQHLLDTQQLEEAGRLKEADGDLQQAVTYYMEGGVPARAAACVITHSVPLDNAVLESILARLAAAGLHEAAGDLLHHLGRAADALAAFRKGRQYARALALAAATPAIGHEVVRLHEEWGDHLVARGQMDNAVSHFVEAGANSKAAHAALQAGNLPRAAGLIDAVPPAEQEALSAALAKLYQQAGSWRDAEKMFVQAGRASAAVHMYFDAGRWDDAHRVAVGYLEDKASMEQLYAQKAREYVGAQQWKSAEKTLLAIGRVDEAMAMHKDAGSYADYLRLAAKHRPDGLQAAQLAVAQAREKEGLLREAERQYCDAGQWKSAVRMYRKANLWEDTLRVAKQHGGVAASKQVAYAWAVQLENEQGAAAKLAMLKKMGLVEYAIEYAVESADFEHAFQLAEQSGNDAKLPDIHLKRAMFLEDDGQFEEAEASFLRANKPREAIEMYMHQQLWEAALRVAEARDAGAVPLVYTSHAAAAATEGNLAEAEQLYLLARAPDAIIKMYREREMWDEAVRVARHYKPEVLHEVESARAARLSRVNAAGSVDAKIQKAKLFERQGAVNSALDAYLSITAADTPDGGKLEAAWGAAVRLGLQAGRAAEVAAECSRRLLAVNRPEAAAQMHLAVDDRRSAVGVLCQAGLLPRARAVAASDPLLLQVVAQFEDGAAGAAAGGVRGGASGAELDELARRGNWSAVHERARAAGPDVAARYVIAHATKLCQQRLFNDAAVMLQQQGAPADVAHVPLCCQICVGVLSLPAAARDAAAEAALASVLFDLHNKLKDMPGAAAEPLANLHRCHEAAHLLVMHGRAEANGWPEIAAKAATSLLRCIGTVGTAAGTAALVPADKAFYLAGAACRRVPAKEGQAFVLLNMFLDISEAVEDGAADGLDMSDFVDTDVPLSFVLPGRDAAYVGADDLEDAKAWVLETAMRQDVDQSLGTRSCANCGADIYEAALKCNKCGSTAEPCAVSGYPIPAGDKVETKGTFKIRAARDDFNTYVAKYGACPVTGTTQTVIQ